MRGRLTAVVTALLLAVLPTAAMAADTIQEQALRQLAQATGATKTTMHSNPVLTWTGVGLMSGGALLTVLSMSALKKETGGCVYIYAALVCGGETSTNWAVMGAGLGMTAGGAIMTIIGSKKHADPVAPTLTVVPTARGLAGRWAF